MESSEVMRLVFGLVAAEETDPAFDALAEWLLEHEDVALEREARPTYRDLMASVRDGSCDVAWLPPVVYAWLAEAVTPIGSLARGGATTYTAALVSREGSELGALEDLRGVRAGWVDPWSAAGYVVPRLELAKAGVDLGAAFRSEAFFGTHKDALLALSRGECDVAGTYARTREGTEEPEGAWSELEDVRVRLITTFGAIPPDVIAARRNLPPAQYERARAALRSACADETARPLVRAVFGGADLHEGLEEGHETLRRRFERATADGLFD